MKKISRVSIDLSKTVFQVHAATSNGQIVWRKRVYRSDLMQLIKGIEACEIGMEACSGANYWGQQFEALGHTVHLIAPQYVKPYVKRNKNDAADADAILEAMSRPTMRFVPVKTVEQQEIGQLHRAREMLVRQRTALVNEIKGMLHEHGVILSRAHPKLRGEYLEALERHGERLGESTKRLMERLFEQLNFVKDEIEKHEEELTAKHKGNTISQQLASIPGVGILTATAVAAAIGDAKRYRNGREFAASLGLVPRQHSSGPNERLGKISKRGDSYIRKLAIQGGHTVVMHVGKNKSKRGEWLRKLIERRGRVKAAVAVANKNARIMWALMVHGGYYNAGHCSVRGQKVVA